MELHAIHHSDLHFRLMATIFLKLSAHQPVAATFSFFLSEKRRSLRVQYWVSIVLAVRVLICEKVIELLVLCSTIPMV